MGAIVIYFFTEGQRRATEIAYPDAHIMSGSKFQPVSVKVIWSVAGIPFAVILLAFQELDAINLYSVHTSNRCLRAIIHYTMAVLLVMVIC
jgi:choline-glycine betaine transporter